MVSWGSVSGRPCTTVLLLILGPPPRTPLSTSRTCQPEKTEIPKGNPWPPTRTLGVHFAPRRRTSRTGDFGRTTTCKMFGISGRFGSARVNLGGGLARPPGRWLPSLNPPRSFSTGRRHVWRAKRAVAWHVMHKDHYDGRCRVLIHAPPTPESRTSPSRGPDLTPQRTIGTPLSLPTDSRGPAADTRNVG